MARSIMDSPGSLFVFRNKPLWAPIHRRKNLGQLFNHQLLRRTLLLRVNEQSAMETTEWFLCYKIQSKWQRWNTSWRRMECGGTVPRNLSSATDSSVWFTSTTTVLTPLRAVNERVPTMVWIITTGTPHFPFSYFQCPWYVTFSPPSLYSVRE